MRGRAPGSDTVQSADVIRRILSKIVNEALGTINMVIYTWRDGIPISYIAPSQSEAEFMSVAVAAAVGALDALGDITNSKIKRLDIELENGEHILISTMDGSILALSTSTRPNLGLIHLVLRKYERELKEKGGIGLAGGPKT